MDFLNKELQQPSVFNDESKLSAEYLPENLLFREDQMKIMARHFRGLMETKGITRKMIIYGPVGSGKTSIAKKVGQWLHQRGLKDEKKVNKVHINCRRSRGAYNILLAIAKELNSHVPTRGYSAPELMGMIVEFAEEMGSILMITLDEIDFIDEEDLSYVLYALTRTNDDIQNSNHSIALVLISRKLSFKDRLDESIASSLAAATIRLEPYTTEQLYEILEDRISESFEFGTVTSPTIELAAEIAGKRGDARHALELIWYAGKYADRDQKTTIIPEYVREAKENIEPSLRRSSLENLTDHELMTVLAISRKLQYSKMAYVTTGNGMEAYKVVCEEFNREPRKHTQFWEYLKELQKRGIISSNKSSFGIRGNTQLLGIHDVSTERLIKEVQKRLHQK